MVKWLDIATKAMHQKREKDVETRLDVQPAKQRNHDPSSTITECSYCHFCHEITINQ
jgi:formate hydrogenlyase subunit 6/NADH:ubiquinone oxidoreductase subunit I